MNNLKKKNKSISTYNSNEYNKSENKFTCIGPCYPPNIIYYHPLYFDGIINYDDHTCPIKTAEFEGKKINHDFCDPKQNTYNPKTFDIFEDVVQIANTPKLFLEQIYKIDDLEDCVKYLNDDFDNIPVYSQKRIINAIVLTWGKNINFPLNLIAHKVKIILEKIFDINLSVEKISKKISNIKDKQNYNDIFNYFLKYSK